MHSQNISVGDIVCFKNVHKISVLDLINRRNNYSKYMLVIKMFNGIENKDACQVLCANGDVNWVATDKLEKI
jgi:hypothetical protein